ncbi:WG repeat-containing protein [Bacteroidales bacterium OttesenSCG-928-M11]|nr:WG repeat-containing protein [Bacteroidales bacterium OttesenSCG-928-M11]
MKHLKLFSVLLLCGILFSCGGGSEGVDKNMIPFYDGEKYVYINQSGKTVLESENAKGTFSDGKAVERDYEVNSFGFINKKGKFVIKPEFKSYSLFSEGIAWVTRENGHPEAINTSGKSLFVLEGAYYANSFNEGVSVFIKLDDEGNHLYGVVDKKGKIIIEPSPNRIEDHFSEGLAVYVNQESYDKGYIDKTGKIAINCQFSSAENFSSNGYAAVEMGDQWGIINKKGEFVINPRFKMIIPDGNLFLFIDEDNKIGWCDKDGKNVITPQFDNAFLFQNNDLAPVKNGNKFGYVNKKGILEIPFQFDGIHPFIDNKVAIVSINDKYGLIDKKGKYIINPMYEGVDDEFVTSLMNNGIVTDRVYTNFFDTQKAVGFLNKMVNNTQINGLHFHATFGDIMDHYKKNQYNFSQSSNAHLLKEGKLNSDISYKFSILGNPWKKGGNWYSSSTFKKETPAKTYVLNYEINLLKEDRTSEIVRDILCSFDKKEESEDLSERRYYHIQKGNLAYAISYRGRNVEIIIEPITLSTNINNYKKLSPSHTDKYNKYIGMERSKVFETEDFSGFSPWYGGVSGFEVLRSDDCYLIFIEKEENNTSIITDVFTFNDADFEEKTYLTFGTTEQNGTWINAFSLVRYLLPEEEYEDYTYNVIQSWGIDENNKVKELEVKDMRIYQGI